MRGQWQMKYKVLWHRISVRWWQSEEVDGTVYHLSEHEEGWRVEDNHGAVWGSFPNYDLAMAAVDKAVEGGDK